MQAAVDITNELQELVGRGGKVTLPAGRFLVSSTIQVPTDCEISGSGKGDTTLMLGDDVNNNMFTNSDHKGGNSKICLKNLNIDGNASAQRKPEGEKRLSFCNIVYFANVKDSHFVDLHIENVYQTALHFRTCMEVTISGVYAAHLGWSGISTSSTDNLNATGFTILDSGNDHRHSAIHLDGGNCGVISGVVDKCVGNGVMLDSSHSKLTNCLVMVKASRCMRGISLIGSAERQTSAVLITKSYVYDNKIGIMVSNAYSAFVHDCKIERNTECGLLFQGRVGGYDSFASNCLFKDNKLNIKQDHQSRNNFFLNLEEI